MELYRELMKLGKGIIFNMKDRLLFAEFTDMIPISNSSDIKNSIVKIASNNVFEIILQPSPTGGVNVAIIKASENFFQSSIIILNLDKCYSMEIINDTSQLYKTIVEKRSGIKTVSSLNSVTDSGKKEKIIPFNR